MRKREYNALMFARIAACVGLDGGVGTVESGAVGTRNGQEGPDVIAKRVTSVGVDNEALRLAMARTGINEPAKLVAFAVGRLLTPDPSADFARAARGSMPGFGRDI